MEAIKHLHHLTRRKPDKSEKRGSDGSGFRPGSHEMNESRQEAGSLPRIGAAGNSRFMAGTLWQRDMGREISLGGSGTDTEAGGHPEPGNGKADPPPMSENQPRSVKSPARPNAPSDHPLRKAGQRGRGEADSLGTPSVTQAAGTTNNW